MKPTFFEHHGDLYNLKSVVRIMPEGSYVNLQLSMKDKQFAGNRNFMITLTKDEYEKKIKPYITIVS